MRNKHIDVWLSFAAIATSAMAGAFLLWRPVSASFVTPTGIRVTGWISETARGLYWPLFVFLLLFAAACHALTSRLIREGEGPSADLLRILRPLLLWPATIWPGFGGQWLGTLTASFFVPFGTTLLAARICLEFYDVARRRLASEALGAFRRRGLVLSALCVLYLAFACLAVICLKRQSFNGGGDVVHYVAMTEALATRGRLDLTDKFLSIAKRQHVNLEDAQAKKALLSRCHMKENAQGRIYSYHSFGLPLAAAPLTRLFGKNACCLLLALFSLAGVAGCVAAARANGAAWADTLLVTGLSACSGLWVLTTASFLPEMPGIALTAWAFWAVLAQGRRGNRAPSTLIAALCCALLPYFHIRFAPLALTLAGLFGIEGLIGREEPFWRGKVPRLALFTALCLVAWGCLYRCHQTMFSVPVQVAAPSPTAAPQAAPSGGAYNYGRVFLSYPMALWGMFADARGLAHLFPALWVLIAAPLAAATRGCRPWRFTLYGFATTVVILVTCCTTRGALIGACLRGRYLFQALPLLLPSLALVFPRLSRTARTWCLFLLLLPVFALALSLVALGGHGLIDMPGQLRETLSCVNLFQPFISCLETTDPLSRACGFAFAGFMLAGSCLLLAARPARGTPLAAGLLLAAGLACGIAAHTREHPFPRHAAGVCLADNRFSVFQADRSNNLSYFENLVPSQTTPGEFRLMLTDDSARCDGRRIFDLSVTEYRRARKRGGRLWHPVRDVGVRLPSCAILVRGRIVRGTGRLVAARGGIPAREAESLAIPLHPGPFSKVFLLEGSGTPTTCNVFLSMDGDAGEAIVDDYFFAPYAKGAEKVLGGLR